MNGLLKGEDKSCTYFANDRNRDVDDKRQWVDERERVEYT